MTHSRKVLVCCQSGVNIRPKQSVEQFVLFVSPVSTHVEIINNKSWFSRGTHGIEAVVVGRIVQTQGLPQNKRRRAPCILHGLADSRHRPRKPKIARNGLTFFDVCVRQHCSTLHALAMLLGLCRCVLHPVSSLSSRWPLHAKEKAKGSSFRLTRWW